MANPENQVEEVIEEVTETPEESMAPTELDLFGMSDEEFLEAEANGTLGVSGTEVETEEEEDASEAPENDSEETSDEDDTNTQEDDENLSEEDTEASEDDDVEFSKEEAYDELMSEFKANGKMMQVKSVEEARKLMQMGANYHKKMNDLSQDRRLIQVLKDQGLTSPEKINFLIDLSKNEPEAIKQLLRDAKLDPLDLDLEGDQEYTPKTYEASEAQVQLQDVLDSLQGSEGYEATMDIVGNKWDGASRVLLAKNPEDIRTLQEQVESGLFEVVTAEVERKRMLGELQGVSDFEAYVQTGNEMYAAQQKAKANAEKIANTTTKTKSDTVAKSKKLAAAPTRGLSQGKKPGNLTKNPLAMSDAEFEAAFGS